MSQPTTAATDSRKRIRIFVNDNPLFATQETMTGAEIAALGGVTVGNQLFLEVAGPGDDVPIGADQHVQLKSGMKFYDVPVGTFG